MLPSKPNLLNKTDREFFPIKVLFQLSGSISCYKSCFLISNLIQEGHKVRVACTPSALKFVGESSFEGLTGHVVLSDIFEPSHRMDHIEWARWADLCILCPASANTVNQMAYGIAQNIVGALFLAISKEKPYIVVPAMNHSMLSHPATQEALKKLKSWGLTVLDTDYGALACGEKGYGRLLSLDKIEKIIFKKINLLRKKILKEGRKK